MLYFIVFFVLIALASISLTKSRGWKDLDELGWLVFLCCVVVFLSCGVVFSGIQISVEVEAKAIHLSNASKTVEALQSIYYESKKESVIEVANMDLASKIIEAKRDLNEKVGEYNLRIIQWRNFYRFRMFTFVWLEPKEEYSIKI